MVNMLNLFEILYSELFFTTMFRNHSYLHHRYSVLFALLLSDSKIHAEGRARGPDLVHLILLLLLLLLLVVLLLSKNDILFSFSI